MVSIEAVSCWAIRSLKGIVTPNINKYKANSRLIIIIPKLQNKANTGLKAGNWYLKRQIKIITKTISHETSCSCIAPHHSIY